MAKQIIKWNSLVNLDNSDARIVLSVSRKNGTVMEPRNVPITLTRKTAKVCDKNRRRFVQYNLVSLLGPFVTQGNFYRQVGGLPAVHVCYRTTFVAHESFSKQYQLQSARIIMWKLKCECIFFLKIVWWNWLPVTWPVWHGPYTDVYWPHVYSPELKGLCTFWRTNKQNVYATLNLF